MKDKLIDMGLTTEQAEKAMEIVDGHITKYYVEKEDYKELEKKYNVKLEAMEKLETSIAKSKDGIRTELTEEIRKDYDSKLQNELKKVYVLFGLKGNKTHNLKDEKYLEYLLSRIDYDKIELDGTTLSGFDEQFLELVKENEIFFEKMGSTPPPNNPWSGMRPVGNPPQPGGNPPPKPTMSFGAQMAQKEKERAERMQKNG